MTITLAPELPDDVRAALQLAGYTSHRLSTEALRHFAGVLYARRVLSLEQAAQLAGLSLWDFLPTLGEQGLPVADYDEQETAGELETAQWLKTHLPE